MGPKQVSKKTSVCSRTSTRFNITRSLSFLRGIELEVEPARLLSPRPSAAKIAMPSSGNSLDDEVDGEKGITGSASRSLIWSNSGCSAMSGELRTTAEIPFNQLVIKETSSILSVVTRDELVSLSSEKWIKRNRQRQNHRYAWEVENSLTMTIDNYILVCAANINGRCVHNGVC